MCDSAAEDPVRFLHHFVHIPKFSFKSRYNFGALQWLLGYVDECEDASALKRHKFPSKINACPSEGAPDDHPGAFHRSLLVFLSPDGSNLHKPGAVRAFRCQLPRENEFYASDASMDENPPDVKHTDPAMAPKDPWALENPSVGTFKELEVIVEPEAETKEVEAEGVGGPSEEAVQAKLAEYQNRVATEGELGEADVAELESMAPGQVKEEKEWRKFQAVTNANPGSILRYATGTGKQPIWARPSPVPSEIPACPRCGADRRFEFQLLPQLLAFLDIDDESPTAPDWLTIAVYTCSANCVPEAGTCQEDESPAYAEEYVFIQPPFQS